jgi:23S rRNA (cytosine1962-C5)-methyltransferase
VVPCLLFEDEHLLVAAKPAGLNTHAPAPYAGEGLYDWLRHREPRWARLSLLHRLDKETSGVLVFGKTQLANRSLTGQFAQHEVRKTYLLVTDRSLPGKDFTQESQLARAGERYVSSRLKGERAKTLFRLAQPANWPEAQAWLQQTAGPAGDARRLVEAEPVTGRTHQIRVHAADAGIPILGDVLYGGTPAARVFLHAAQITLRHPASGESLTFNAPPDFAADPALALRAALVDPGETDAYRVCHGAADSAPGWYVDRLGGALLAQSEAPPEPASLARWRTPGARSVYHKRLNRQVRRAEAAALGPQLLAGEPAPERFVVRENGLPFELSFAEGYSTGLFLDQRDNRRRLLTGHVAADFALPPLAGTEVLNLFAYTCGFSVCAARAGARVTSVDLSRKYLDWGRRNFVLNQLDPAQHDFIYGDAFDWLRRLAKKGRAFAAVLLDPPTFSASKAGGVFQVERDYGRLVTAALSVLRPEGVLFASTNAATWRAEAFLDTVRGAVHAAGRVIAQEQYFPQPPDYPVSRAEPAYLKTVWLRVR